MELETFFCILFSVFFLCLSTADLYRLWDLTNQFRCTYKRSETNLVMQMVQPDQQQENQTEEAKQKSTERG